MSTRPLRGLWRQLPRRSASAGADGPDDWRELRYLHAQALAEWFRDAGHVTRRRLEKVRVAGDWALRLPRPPRALPALYPDLDLLCRTLAEILDAPARRGLSSTLTGALDGERGRPLPSAGEWARELSILRSAHARRLALKRRSGVGCPAVPRVPLRETVGETLRRVARPAAGLVAVLVLAQAGVIFAGPIRRSWSDMGERWRTWRATSRALVKRAPPPPPVVRPAVAVLATVTPTPVTPSAVTPSAVTPMPTMTASVTPGPNVTPGPTMKPATPVTPMVLTALTSPAPSFMVATPIPPPATPTPMNATTATPLTTVLGSPPREPMRPPASPVPALGFTARWKAEAGNRNAVIELARGSTTTKLELIGVRAGEFTMGDRLSSEPDARAERPIKVKELFLLAKTETTQQQLAIVLGHNPSKWPASAPADLAREPASGIDWATADEFCRLLAGALKGRVRAVRLPWEFEWEYAAKQDTVLGLPPSEYAVMNLRANFSRPAAVGSRKPGRLGFWDLLGNVNEWVADFYEANAYLRPEPQGPATGAQRVARGGSFVDGETDVSAVRRFPMAPERTDGGLGFRICVTP